MTCCAARTSPGYWHRMSKCMGTFEVGGATTGQGCVKATCAEPSEEKQSWGVGSQAGSGSHEAVPGHSTAHKAPLFPPIVDQQVCTPLEGLRVRAGGGQMTG